MKRINLTAPFTSGMVSDIPAHGIGPQHSSFAQDGYSPNGIFRQRAGWAYNGNTQTANFYMGSIYRVKFALADTTRTVVIDTDVGTGNGIGSWGGGLYIHSTTGAGTSIATGGQKLLARCVYNDELMLCAQDGETPMRRYSGIDVASNTYTGGPTTTANEATITGQTHSTAPLPGGYWNITIDGLGSVRVLEGATTSLTLDDIKASAATSVASSGGVTATGITSRCVSIYSAGTATCTTSTLTGYGTKFQTFGVTAKDALVMIPASGNATAGFFSSTPASETSISGTYTAQATKSSYAITRACPFKDAQSHKGSLWGTGVLQYPNRVYVSPPNWSPGIYPGFELPYDLSTGASSANANDFFLDYIDIPGPYDGDHNVAILSSPNPLLVLKRKAVYGIFGSYGSASADLIADGIGCIDIRSAWSYDEGQFWAGETGIFMYANGTITDLTAGKINREWRALTRDFTYDTNLSDYCSLFIASGHLVVHITTGDGATQRTFICDLRDQSWQSRVTNVNPITAFTSRIPGEKEMALFVSDDIKGRIGDFAPAVDGSGTAKDDAGTAPFLKAHTTSAIAQSEGINGLTRLVDLEVGANVYDAGTAGSTQLEVSVVSGGGTSNEADSTKTLDTINSDTVDRIDRHQRRVARRGRFHQVQFEVDTLGTDSTATKVEIHQITARVKELRPNA